MATSKKMPGMVTDPWRNSPNINKMLEPPPPAVISTQEIEEDLQDQKFATIELKGYGGITVDGTNELKIAAVRILEFCIAHQTKIEDYFTEHGIVVTKLPKTSLSNVKFYIQRGDGWILAIPDAKTRDEGCFQLIQAMLKIQAQPSLNTLLTEFKIRPFRR